MKTRSFWMRVFLFIGLVLLLDVIGATLVGAIQLQRASSALDQTASALRDDDIAVASTASVRAVRTASSAARLTGHPGFRLLTLIPWIKDDADAFESLARTAELGAASTANVVGTLVDLGAHERGIVGTLYDRGAIEFGALEKIADAGRDALASLDKAQEVMKGQHAHLGPLDRRLNRTRNRLASLGGSIRRGLDVVDILPDMVGADGDRRYLLAFQSPSEARGGGGLVGVYGLLSASGGQVNLDEVGPIEDLGPIIRPPVHAPRSFAALYGPLSGLRDWRQANLSPDFAATSDVMLEMFKRVRNETLDGVIAMDPIALGEMTRGTGSIKAAGWNKSITRKNSRRLLLFRVYKHFVNRERVQNAYLRNLVNTLWSTIESGDVDAGGLTIGLRNSVVRHHLKIYSTHPDEQRLLGELGITSDPSLVEGPLQLVFNNSNSANKLDFFLHRRQDTKVMLNDDGSADVRVTMELTNDVPRRGLRAVGRAGVRTGLDLGTNRMTLHFMLPRGARAGRYTVDGRSQPSYSGQDAGHPVDWAVVEIAPEATIEAALSYSIPEVVADDRFTFTLWPQAAARSDRYTFEVTAPPGYSLIGPGGHADRVISVEGVLKQPVTMSWRIMRSAEEG